MARDFYPFVEGTTGAEPGQGSTGAAPGPGPASYGPGPCTPGSDSGQMPALDKASCPARIAVYDDAAAAPRVVIVEPQETRSYLEEITATVTKLSHDQGGAIPFMVIREVVENLIHAYFREPAITIFADGNTIRFADQGPGIHEKARALEYGTTSATEEMKHYIRGVGSGLPYAQLYLQEKGGSLQIEDNIIAGTIVTISLPTDRSREAAQSPAIPGGAGTISGGAAQAGMAATQDPWAAQGMPYPAQAYPTQAQQMPAYGAGQGAAWPQATNPWAQPGIPYPAAQTAMQAAYQQGYGMPGQAGGAPQAWPAQVPPAQGAWPQTAMPGTGQGQGGMPAPANSQFPGTARTPETDLSSQYQSDVYSPHGAQGLGNGQRPNDALDAMSQSGATPTTASQSQGGSPGADYSQGPGMAQGAQGLEAVGPAAAQAETASASGANVSERGKLVLAYLARHESVGPTELVAEYGLSQPTWSRELRALEKAGIVCKRGGQKRYLTSYGATIAP